ncbi:hypothetical protein FRE64_01815 [Euhalothece natronophila Z-M001]|uniref:Uncharacterized protein n=1 Tax=Euhalothece natronophila Z-M001 TaxID=522448 RepID=A0A5B8NIK7_9CHRO|nr:hypothetical protein [Euhalothece natronophila]QDZ38786.1 hypothetical protein FRE64_01815 [Euhalothece natronophila Z-M001]
MVQQVNSIPETEKFQPLFDPYLLQRAQHIYEKCYEIYPKKAEQMQGIAINRETYRGQLIFKEKPILLPWETFIPSEELEIEVSDD